MKKMFAPVLLSFGLILSGAGDADAALRGNPSSKVYHTETCKAAKNMKEAVAFGTEADAKGKGFSPCLICFPDAAKKIQASTSSPYVGNPKSKVFHKAGCKVAPKKNPVILQNLLEAHKQGFKPCKTCVPMGKVTPAMAKEETDSNSINKPTACRAHRPAGCFSVQ